MKNLIKTKTTKMSPKTTAVKTAVVPKITKVVSFTNKNIKISPRKLRLLANTIKKLSPQTALTQLKFINSLSARVLYKALQSIIADAQNNHQLNPSTLSFEKILVDHGPKLKRMDKSHGSRFARGLIQKRHSRLFISVKGTSQ